MHYFIYISASTISCIHGIISCILSIFIYQIIHPSTNYHEQQFSLIDNYSHLYLIPTIVLGINFKIPHSIYYPLNHFQIHLFQIFSKRNKIVSLHEHPLEPPITPINSVGITCITNCNKTLQTQDFPQILTFPFPSISLRNPFSRTDQNIPYS